jgi:hypothetical protein
MSITGARALVNAAPKHGTANGVRRFFLFVVYKHGTATEWASKRHFTVNHSMAALMR